ncbi:Helix-turn-helix domain protein [Mycobacterium marinum]|uniref:excisionase family DNA-binding protein n=1 Tax=Mycobacterium marinum TaxID=1781 RepID=UPI000E3B64E0|nr:excisionase family DNA-binding protein [Mycobacterium marinum]RFZ48381.1 Helix-turn-helix domain protein [Mycobacterium marinum]
MSDRADVGAACLHSVESAFNRLCVSRAKGYELIANGKLRSVKIGRRRLVPESAIVEFIGNLEAGGVA